MSEDEPDHYATLGLDRQCTAAQIRTAYRLLARRHHPDLNPGDADALTRSQALNAAHAVLGDPARRRAYDAERHASDRPKSSSRAAKIERDVAQDVHLRIEDYFRGVSLEVRVKDPLNPHGHEVYSLEIPAGTPPGERLRIARTAPFEGGFVKVRLRVLPGFRFKASGSDLRCDLRIDLRRVTQGGTEVMPGPDGRPLRVAIPAGVGRGEVIRLPGEGLPKARGGRGDLLVRLRYQPQVHITRRAGR